MPVEDDAIADGHRRHVVSTRQVGVVHSEDPSQVVSPHPRVRVTVRVPDEAAIHELAAGSAVRHSTVGGDLDEVRYRILAHGDQGVIELGRLSLDPVVDPLLPRQSGPIVSPGTRLACQRILARVLWNSRSMVGVVQADRTQTKRGPREMTTTDQATPNNQTRGTGEGRDVLAKLAEEVAATLPSGGDWCSLHKAQTLAALVLGLRPRTCVEVGVWTGGSLIPVLLALRALGRVEQEVHGCVVKRRALAIDAWSAEASCVDQSSADQVWWGRVDHEAALQTFLTRLSDLELSYLCDVVRASSDRAPVPARIDLLHLDGNHGAQAVRDVERFGSAVAVGGVLVLDDLDWSGGHVAWARDRALELGFESRYPLGTGVVLQRVEASRG